MSRYWNPQPHRINVVASILPIRWATVTPLFPSEIRSRAPRMKSFARAASKNRGS